MKALSGAKEELISDSEADVELCWLSWFSRLSAGRLFGRLMRRPDRKP